ncbi:hypothetical protein E2C01_048081 [Portunus trituberculatus]|uniref:Uncharacterized protein n=1 Tax=Portunus trituberculatus TaxID=210409 RepID=A0A5B7GA80_PORTR|nr:hypothetical protein [Portunus trituberculatus]
MINRIPPENSAAVFTPAASSGYRDRTATLGQRQGGTLVACSESLMDEPRCVSMNIAFGEKEEEEEVGIGKRGKEKGYYRSRKEEEEETH